MPDLENRFKKPALYTDTPSGPAAVGGATPLTNRAMEMALSAPADRSAPPAGAEPQRKIALPAWLTMLGGNAADIGTTMNALGAGATEANPLLGPNPSMGRILGTKAAGVGIQALLMKLLERRGKVGVANALGYGSGAVMGGVAANNMIQAKKAKGE